MSQPVSGSSCYFRVNNTPNNAPFIIEITGFCSYRTNNPPCCWILSLQSGSQQPFFCPNQWCGCPFLSVGGPMCFLHVCFTSQTSTLYICSHMCHTTCMILRIVLAFLHVFQILLDGLCEVLTTLNETNFFSPKLFFCRADKSRN